MDQDKPANDADTDRAPGAGGDVPENEMMRETRALREQELAAEKAEAARKTDKAGLGWKTAAGIGIGSAALLAALLYAHRDKD